ncbi:MAG: hypothetical protein ACYTFX_12110 [Planctomycetota bacterium]
MADRRVDPGTADRGAQPYYHPASGCLLWGLTTGIAVIFFAFGPGLYFLYADRIRGKQPHLPPQEPAEGPAPEIPPQG